MAVTVYRNTDASSPGAMAGSAGTVVGVLDACLVNGYGSKPAAGWTKPYSGTGLASYRQASGSLQHYVDVVDNGPGAGGLREARLRGYETMTALSTGTGPFPTAAQATPGVVCRKSATADGTARNWIVIADDRTFYMFLATGDTAGWYMSCGFGDFYSYVSGTDSYRTMIWGRVSENDGTATAESDSMTDMNSTTGAAQLWVAKTYNGSGGSTQHYRGGDRTKGGSGSQNGQMALPSVVDGRVWLSPLYIMIPGSVMRGKFRGLYHFLHPISSVADGDTISGSGVYAGRTFLIIKQTPNAGVWCVDTTGPWDTN